MLSDLHLLTLAVTFPAVFFGVVGIIAYRMGLPMQTRAHVLFAIAFAEWVIALVFGAKAHLATGYVSPVPTWQQVAYTVALGIGAGLVVLAFAVAADLWEYEQPVIEPPEDQ